MIRGRSCACLLALYALLQLVPSGQASAATPGVVLDLESGKAFLFDAETDTITGSVALGPNISGSGDCVILGDRGPAFATDFGFRLWALDMEAIPVRLAPPPNPIHLSNPGEDIAVGPGGRYLVACDGSGTAPIAVVDAATGQEVSTFSLGTDCNSVDVCANGSVLVTSSNAGLVRRLVLDAAGHLSDTGESLAAAYPMNVYCSPASTAGMVVTFSPGTVQTFLTSGMTHVDTRVVPQGLSAVIDPHGDKVYVRSGSAVDAYGWNPATGQLDASPLLEVHVDGAASYPGVENIAIDPSGSRLYIPWYGYVPGYAKVSVYDAASGALLATMTHPDLIRPNGICLPPLVDRDDDGLPDSREETLGTDPLNPDSDGDGLRDGFEADHGFNPLVAGEAGQDPDADGLTNFAEQSAGTDPLRADTDADGLGDGAEVLSALTDPRNPDTDGDLLSDGDEVVTWLTDPRNPDTDGGGVRDGDEALRDLTRPLDPADDQPAGLGMVVDNFSRNIVVFDRDTLSVVASPSLPTYTDGAGDCVITVDGASGFATDFNYEVTAVDLHATPPALAEPPNPIAISNPGEDLALSPDGRYLVACDGGGPPNPVSVIDVATRAEISTLALGTDCNSVDVCPDGSVLVTSFTDNAVRRLTLSAAGALGDLHQRLPIPLPVNVLCSPDGRTGLVVSRNPSQALTSFTLPDLAVVDTRALPVAAFAAVISPLGDAVYVRHTDTDTGGIQAFHYDPATGHLSADPFLSFFVASTRRFFGMEQLAMDPGGRRLFVTEAGGLSVFDAATGRRLAEMFDPALEAPSGVCLHAPDRDHDGLSDALERNLGTDPDNPDSDGDGLSDGFEVRQGFDPLLGGDGTGDPDGDGLDNLAEQAAGTDARNPDTDRDGLDDGQEVLTWHTDPRDPDTDRDRLSDGAEVGVQHTDPLQADTDGGGVLDGNEVVRDGSDPLNPADDRSSGRGIATSSTSGTIEVFDTESEEMIASIGGGSTGACVISNDGRTGYVVPDGAPYVSFVDLDATPPRFSSAVTLPSSASELALTPDGRFLIVCSPYAGPGYAPLMVVDTATRAVTGTFPGFNTCNAVAACADGSVLVASSYGVRRLEVSPAGSLSDTGERIGMSSPRAIACSRDGRSAVAIGEGGTLDSFLVAGMAPVDHRALPGGWSLALTPTNDRVVAQDFGGIRVYGYDPGSAHLSVDPTLQISTNAFRGAVAVNRAGTRLFLADVQALRIYDLATGAVTRVIPRSVPIFVNDASRICLRAYDLDSDGLLDDEEPALGTDPRNSDTDGDGLTDGFEAAHGLDPRDPGDAADDPDADGLTNAAEQAAGTDPRSADTDADGLGDGAEVLTYSTSPRRADSDADGLTDGDEVNIYGTDPANPDTDNGGVQDGDEVHRDGTDPRLTSDDRPSSPGIVLDTFGDRALVFSPDANRVLGPVSLAPHTSIGDCAITADGRTAFVRDLAQKILAVDLAATPPALAPAPNPIPISNAGYDFAISHDGRYLVVCGDNYLPVGMMSVVDTASRRQVSTFPLACTSVDVCDDGTVLVATGWPYPESARRLRLGGAGSLFDTGDLLPVAGQSSSTQRISCAPGSGYGVLLNTGPDRARVFRVPGMTEIDQRTLPAGGVGAAWRRTGSHAVFYVRLGNGGTNGVLAYDFNLRAGVLAQDPFLAFPAPGVKDLALDRTGTALYLATVDGLEVSDADTGRFLRALPHEGPLQAPAVCLPPPGDRDGDGLKDDEERRLGTDPDRSDTDGDGLPDAYEAWYDLDPVSSADAHQDADGDGLDNTAERAAGTDPRNPDTDGDGLSDGAEVRQYGTNPLVKDSDGDAYLDGVDNCPAIYNPDQRDTVHPGGFGDACEDPDHDGVVDLADDCPDAFDPAQADTDHDGRGDACDTCPFDALDDRDGDGFCAGDNCPMLPNPEQADADRDGVGDVCDICPDVPDATQAESVACIATTDDGGTCLETQIDLIGEGVNGTITLAPAESGMPDALRFEVLDTACLAGDVFSFELNGVALGGFEADPAVSCDCIAPIQTFLIADQSLFQTAWRPLQENRFVLRKTGEGAAVSWVRVVAVRNGVDHAVCLFDAGAADCTAADICANGLEFFLPEAQANVPDPLSTMGDPVVSVPFMDSVLPGRLDLAPLADGPAFLCLSGSAGGGALLKDCHPLTKQGERRLTINGAVCDADPTAVITTAAGDVECVSPAGAPVTLDGSASSDPDSTPETQDDLAAFDWFENFGLPGQVTLGSGAILHVTLALGSHAITLRVTDRAGRAATTGVILRVVDTSPPSILVSVTPASLWPPAHQMVKVTAAVTATDACGAPAVTLVSVISSEPDDAPGGADGNTVDDIQGAALGTPDVSFSLRAERLSTGPGRTYRATYLATDASGRTSSAEANVFVPHDRAHVTDPIDLRVRQTVPGTVVEWIDAGGSEDYSVLRGTLSAIRETASSIDLGPVVCLASHITEPGTEGHEDGENPPVGGCFFYLVEFVLDGQGTYGSDTASKPLVPGPGACP